MSLSSVKNYFKQYNMDTHIVEFPVSSATVELAAQAIGCKEQEIAKTMSFHVGEEVIVIVRLEMHESIIRNINRSFTRKLKCFMGMR